MTRPDALSAPVQMILFGVLSAADAKGTQEVYSTAPVPGQAPRATAAAAGTQRSQHPAHSTESQASSSGSSAGANVTAALVSIVDLQIQKALAWETFLARCPIPGSLVALACL